MMGDLFGTLRDDQPVHDLVVLDAAMSEGGCPRTDQLFWFRETPDGELHVAMAPQGEPTFHEKAAFWKANAIMGRMKCCWSCFWPRLIDGRLCEHGTWDGPHP